MKKIKSYQIIAFIFSILSLVGIYLTSSIFSEILKGIAKDSGSIMGTLFANIFVFLYYFLVSIGTATFAIIAIIFACVTLFKYKTKGFFPIFALIAGSISFIADLTLFLITVIK